MSAKLDNLEQSIHRSYMAGSTWSEIQRTILYARKLETALEFYALPENYIRQEGKHPYLVVDEGGELAREALRKGKES